MRMMMALTLAGLVCACEPSGTNSRSAEPAAEAPDPEQVAAEKRFPRAPGQSDAYYAAKIVSALQFKSEPDGHFANPDLEDRFQTFSDGHQIWGCGQEFGAVWDSEVSLEDDSGPPIDPARERELALQDIAYRAVALQLMLVREGKNEALTASAIAEWEAVELANFAASRESPPQTYRGVFFGNGIVGDVEMVPEDYALMVRLNRTTQAGLEATDGCGAGEFVYVIKTQPPGASASVIRQFDFDLCQVRGIKPFDRIRCRGWRDVADGRAYLMSGNYRYVIENAGNRDSGTFTAQRTNKAMSEGETIVIGKGGPR